MEEKTRYTLAARHGKSFLPLYISENHRVPPTLKEIDDYTSQQTLASFVQEQIARGLSKDEPVDSIEIIYKKGPVTKWIPEGICFIEDSELLNNPDKIIEFIMSNITNLTLLNKLYNYFRKFAKDRSDSYKSFVAFLNYVHKVIKGATEETINSLRRILSEYIGKLNYEELRSISMFISKNYINKELSK